MCTKSNHLTDMLFWSQPSFSVTHAGYALGNRAIMRPGKNTLESEVMPAKKGLISTLLLLLYLINKLLCLQKKETNESFIR